MKLKWTTPLVFVNKGRFAWIGELRFQRQTIEVISNPADDERNHHGDAPTPQLLADIEDRVVIAVVNRDQNAEKVSSPIANLYNERWKPDGGKDINAAAIKKKLRLHCVFLFQGPATGIYMLKYRDTGHFGGYNPFAQFDGDRLHSAGVNSPIGKNGKMLLPYPGIRSQAKVPKVEKSSSAVGKIVPTDQFVEFRWQKQLAWNTDSGMWCGRVTSHRKPFDLRVDSSENSRSFLWVDARVQKILEQLVPATDEAVRQLTDLYNGTWIEDKELSSAAIKRRITRGTIDFARTGSWTMCFEDRDLFGGHMIQVTVTSRGRVTTDLVG